MKKVVVLMSTYNGEKYLNEQIESIVNQRGVEITLIIRDDGSTDTTIKIIENYMKQYNNIKLYKESNIGPKMSFLNVSKMAPDADFYAFSDQDDVWCQDKLVRAVSRIKNEDEYQLYTSAFDVVDENLNIIKERAGLLYDYSLCESIMYRAPLGCTIVMNKKLFNIFRNSRPTHFRMHDHWAILTAEVLKADIIIDKKSFIKYRQHENNVVGGNSGFVTHCKRYCKSLLYNKNERSKQAISLLENYKNYFDKETELILRKICGYRKSITKRFQLAFDDRFIINDKRVLLMFRLSVLMGVF